MVSLCTDALPLKILESRMLCFTICVLEMFLKCPYDQIFDIHFFYIFVHSRSSLDILPNFNLLQSIECTFFGPLFP